jgi:prevent-host-death family protein
MRTIPASEAKTRLAELLSDVERGETIIITRHGRAIARIEPEAAPALEARRVAIEQLKAFRASMPRLSLDEFLEGRHEGHRY